MSSPETPISNAATATAAAPAPGQAKLAIKRKRVVTTAAEREKAKLKAEEIRWKAAKTPEAKAWINSTRLLKEFLTNSSNEEILLLKVNAATRRDVATKSDAMGLHVEMLDTRARKDAPLDSWIVIGRLSARLAVAGKVRDIERQNKRDLQKAEEDAEAEAEAEANAEASEQLQDSTVNSDPTLGEQRAPVAQMMPGSVETDKVLQRLPPIDQTPNSSVVKAATEAGQNHAVASSADKAQAYLDLPGEDIRAAKQLSHLKSQPATATAVVPEQSDVLAVETKDDPETDRISSWVSQQVQSAQQEKDRVDPTGKWNITCAAITEQLGSPDTTLTMVIHLEKTNPQTDKDTDDTFQTDNMDTSSTDLTPNQAARQGTYQLWATFNLGLYKGIIRFMSPTTIPKTSQLHQRADFDLQPSQLPSLTNRTFQYKWRGRDMASDAEICIGAEKATRWIKFEEDGLELSGVFESEYLSESGLQGRKVAKADADDDDDEAEGLQLGRLWSELSPQAHEYEATQN
jgi:hypothetical protein